MTRRVFVCMELSSKLELIHVPNNCSCLLISTLIYRGSTVGYSGVFISIEDWYIEHKVKI